MTLAELSILRPVLAWMMMFAIILFGGIAFQRLGVSYLPDIDYPVLNINVVWQGAAPEVMEQDIVDPIEERVVMTEGVREVHSNIGPSTANVTLYFDTSTNINSALQEVESYLQQLRLPLGVQPPTIRKSNPEDDPIMRIAVYGNTFSMRDLADYVDKEMQTSIQVVPGVGQVSVSGFGQRALRIYIDNDKLTKLDLTAEDVANAVQNQNLETSSGFLENHQHYYSVRTVGEGITPEQIGDILLLSRGGASIYDSHIHIRDVARVIDGLTDQRSIARLDSKEAVTLDIKKQHGFNEVQVADNVRAKLEILKQNLPPGMRTEVVVDYTRFTKKAVDQTQHELLVAGILTSVICFLFLGTWSSSVNVLISIPTSLAGAFLILYELHFTLNLFTLLALALAIGIVVDDAIMVLENIVRHFEMGKKRRRAALDGAKEITPAAVAATVAVVAIFLPVAFMQGVIGYFFFQFGITITVAVLFSLLEAITLTPMRCSRMLTSANKRNYLVYASETSFGFLTRVYKSMLSWALKRRALVLISSAAMFGLSVYGVTLLRHEFVPPQDQNFFHIAFEAPLNASIYYTDEKAKLVEDYLKTLPEVDHYLTNTSGHYGNFDVVLVAKSKRVRSQADIIQACRDELSSAKRFQPLKFWFSDLSGRGLSGGNPAPISFSIQGPDYDTLYGVTSQITDRLKASGKIIDINTDYRAGVPEEEIIPDRSAAAIRGVSVDSIANTISIAIGGTPVGKFTSGGHRYDVLVQSDVTARASIADIGRLKVRNQYGELIPMTEVTTFKERTSVLNETRINRLREIGITGNIAPGVSQGDALALAEKVSRELCPASCQFSFQGSGRSYQDTFSSLWFALALGIIVAYMVLAAQFNSFIHPISVLMALPFSLTGAVMALYLTNQSLNLFSMIGLILLMGLAKKNSILLVEFTNHVRAQDKRPLRQALLDACPIRFRPIMMTSLATISSAIPSALGLGPGSETRVPMAIAVIGGVFVSTLFTLFVVPCTYSVLANFEGKPNDDEEDDPLPPSHLPDPANQGKDGVALERLT